MSVAAALNSIGTVRNIGLKNELLVIELAKSFIEDLEFLQAELLGKMDKDRKQTDVLKERLKVMQNAARSIKDPNSDSAEYKTIITFDDSIVPPFPDMEKIAESEYSIDADPKLGGPSYFDLKKAGGTVWRVKAGSNNLTGKQVFTYLDQQAESIKSAITALNSITSQDNLTLQSLRSKIESTTQFLSTLLKNSYDVGASVLRNFPG
ncbi:hypothetical protein RAE19_18980 [Rhodoferax sp. TBRC 17660]|jgi:uncharacterized coiled-coil protein SlyX|uniref:Uncharacterized protein n=1 Tax=Rhodoferax potami TaxID=3068338 RepID=A0ABU3KTB5_9BURK|nr:hypothetical protein [Rhodoferax sp. TBRC 17660]MDT7520728.1 hypothetical protein [Rhodoferax sp. TBRC 17660]